MKERNYGIDLLRLILMYMVCILHVLGQGGILNVLVPRTTNYVAYQFLEILSYCAVDGFALITGYTAKNRENKFDKIINMWFQVFFYSFILTFVLWLITKVDVEALTLVKQMFPVTFSTHWYFTAYFGLYFAMPFLNSYLFSMSLEKAKHMLIIIMILFCGLGLIKDAFKTEYGYSMLWLIILYIIGVLAKRLHLLENIKTAKLIFGFLFCFLCNLLLLVFTGIGIQINYTSPTVLSCAFILIVLFARISFSRRSAAIIKYISKWAFGIYLFQCNYVIWNHYLYNTFVSFADANVFYGFGGVLLAATIIFIIGLITEAIRSFLHNALHIPGLCRIIARKINIIIVRLVEYLKRLEKCDFPNEKQP